MQVKKDKNTKPKQDISEVDKFINYFINNSILINGVPLSDNADKAENSVEKNDEGNDDI